MTDTVGVTATRRGLTDPQLVTATDVLRLRYELGAHTLHHGACVGGDERLAEVAFQLGYTLEAWPAELPARYVSERALALSHVVHDQQPPLERNHDIVDHASDCLVVCPGDRVEKLRSGTWATVRYARRRPSLPRLVCWPDGAVNLDMA